MNPTACRHVSSNGTKCQAWANATGLCPTHAGFIARGPAIYTPAAKRHNDERLDALHAKLRMKGATETWSAACGCVTGRDAT